MGATLTRSPSKTALKNILFATDFSPCSEVALPFEKLVLMLAGRIAVLIIVVLIAAVIF